MARLDQRMLPESTTLLNWASQTVAMTHPRGKKLPGATLIGKAVYSDPTGLFHATPYGNPKPRLPPYQPHVWGLSVNPAFKPAKLRAWGQMVVKQTGLKGFSAQSLTEMWLYVAREVLDVAYGPMNNPPP